MKVASILCLVFVIDGVSAVQLNKPLPNVLAVVGRPFAYSIPKDPRRKVQYKVFEEGKATLPKWLSYDPEQNILQGVPVARDRRVYRMAVLGVETIVFTLEVRDLETISNMDIIYGTNHTKVQNLRLQKCADGKPLSVATIAFDLNIKTLSGQARMDLIKKASSFGDLPVDQFYMRSGRAYETALRLNEVTVLTAGPGNVRDPKEQGVTVSWMIGCGVDTELEGTRVASKFKSSAETNSFRELFGAPVSGWHLATGFPKKPKKRVRRQAAFHGSASIRVTATPVATASVPVSREESRTVVISPTAFLAPISTTLAIPFKPSLEETAATTSVSLAQSVPHTIIESPTVDIHPSSSVILAVRPSEQSEPPSTAVESATVIKSSPVVPAFATDITYVESPSAVMSSTVVIAPLTTVVSSVVSAPAIPVTQETKTYATTTVAVEPSPEISNVPAVTSPTETSAPLLIQPTSVIQPPAGMSSTVVLPERPISSSPVLTDTKTSAVEEVATSVMLLLTTTPAMAAKMATQEKQLQMTTELIRTTTLATHTTTVATQTQLALSPPITTTQSLPATSILMPQTTPKEPVVSTEKKPATNTTKPDTQRPIWLNFRPKLKKKIGRITLLVGQNLLYHIPEDSFYDEEDGNTRNLRLQLETTEDKPVSANSWIQLREDKQEIYGLPMDVSFRLYHYKLIATDSGNKSIADEFEVTVQEDRSKSNHQFTIHMLLDHVSFMKNTPLHTLLLEKIAGYFGVNVTNIRLVGFASGSVLFTFRFDFVQYEPCNHDEMLELISKFQDSNGAVSENLRRSLLPEFPVESGSFSLSGPCSDVVESKTKGKGESEDDRAWWIYAIIPAVALVALIIITCVVVIRHRQKKLMDLSEDRSAYLHLYQKTPTVMQDEYELKEQSPLM